MPMMTSQILTLQKRKNLDISITKLYFFFFKQKSSLITHQGLLYNKKRSVAKAAFKCDIPKCSQDLTLKWHPALPLK